MPALYPKYTVIIFETSTKQCLTASVKKKREAVDGVNQMVRRLNAGGSVCKEDIEEINTKLEQVYKVLIRVMRGLGKIR